MKKRKYFLLLALLSLNTFLIHAQRAERQFCSKEDPSNAEETTCPLMPSDVIGFQSDNSHSVYDNACEACRDEKVVYYYDLEYCPSDSSQTQCYNGQVCVLLDDKITTVESGCAACQQYGPGTLFFRDVCPLSRETIGFCTDEKRNQQCSSGCVETEDGQMVCADLL